MTRPSVPRHPQTAPVDMGGRAIVDQVLAAVARGENEAVADLLGPLQADQVQALVKSLAHEALQITAAAPDIDETGPDAVCQMAITSAAKAFGTTPEAILSPEKTRSISDARWVAMTAARNNGLTLPAIAKHFGRNHASVIHAVRNTAEKPRLAAAAAKIGDQIHEQLSAPHREQAPVRGAPAALSPHLARIVSHAVTAAAKEFGVQPEKVLGPAKQRTPVDARAVAMSAARSQGVSMAKIAEAFARDHSTVQHAVRRVEQTPALVEATGKVVGEIQRHMRTPENTPGTGAARQQAGPESTGIVGYAIKAASERFGVPPEHILGPTRERGPSDARAVAMSAVRAQGLSLPTIAKAFDRDHSTVLHATRRVTKIRELAEAVDTIATDISANMLTICGKEPAAATPGVRPETTPELVAEGTGHTRAGADVVALPSRGTRESQRATGTPAAAPLRVAR